MGGRDHAAILYIRYRTVLFVKQKKTVYAASRLRKPFLFPGGIDNPAAGTGRLREAAGGFAIARTRSVKRQRRALSGNRAILP